MDKGYPGRHARGIRPGDLDSSKVLFVGLTPQQAATMMDVTSSQINTRDTSVTMASAEISSDHVRDALNDLLYPCMAPSSNPLEQLWLVDQVLTDPAFPHVTHSRRYALAHVMTSAITQGWKHQRSSLGLEFPLEVVTRQEVYDDLEAAAQQGSVELISWSILHYRYVRVELDVQPRHFYTVLGINERTFRRYQTRGVLRLTNWLIQTEWQARFRKMRQEALTCFNATRVGLRIKV